MAGGNTPCLHCGNLIAEDSKRCAYCGSASPFVYVCPDCCQPVHKGEESCPSCGRLLQVVCPNCGGKTFVQERCQLCGANLLLACPNPRCADLNFFTRERCWSCGRKLTSRRRLFSRKQARPPA